MTSESYRDLLLHGGFVDLGERAILRFTGADRIRYLNGQITANVQSLASGRGTPACVTTAKGKLCAEGVVTNAGDALFFDADLSLREVLPPRFERYIISDDVTLEDVSDEFRLIHAFPSSEKPDESQCAGFEGFKSVTSRFGRPGFDLFVPFDKADAFRGKLTEVGQILTTGDAENFRIELGIPRWGMELDENTLPPEAGLDRTHIDYHKGCYIGQEVISRLKSVGHVNRRLVGFISASGAPLERESKIFPASAPAGEPCGVVTSVGWSFALERPVALGYLRRSAPPGDFVVRREADSAEPVPVTLSELPFTK